MNIYIPIATGQKIPQAVFDGIAMQTEKLTPIIVESKGEVNSEHVFTPLRIQSEIRNRNEAIRQFLLTNDPFFFMCCSDVEQLYDTNFAQQIAVFTDSPEIGACALPFAWASYVHVDIASICIKREVIEKGFVFANRYEKCLCTEMYEDLKMLGFLFRWMGNKNLIKNGVSRE